MSPEAILVAGKALAWIGLPLALACWELWRLRRYDDRPGRSSSPHDQRTDED